MSSKCLVSGMACMVFLVMLLVGCGEETALPLISDSAHSPLSLFVSSNEIGEIRVSLPNGETCKEEVLQELIRITVQKGEVFETQIIAQSPIERYNVKRSVAIAAPPRSQTVRLFISDVSPTWDGVVVTLTDLGLSLGLSWQGAWTLACYTLFEYELQEPSCANWPSWFYQAVREQIRLEMFYHSLAFYYWHSPRFRTVNIAFGNLP